MIRLPVPASAATRVHLLDAEGRAVCGTSPGAVRLTTTTHARTTCIHCRARVALYGLPATTTDDKEPTT